MPDSRVPSRLLLALILAVGAALRGWGLATSAFVVPYYFAGVRSMSSSWHNFFFNAFDPAGFLSLDKPPVVFWIQAASAKLFGFNTVAILLPQVLEGLAAIAMLYVLVRRQFGEAAGLLAALFLAVTPISVAVDRSNSTESCLVLTLLVAAWALSRSIESGKLRDLLLSAAVIGLGFNVKMLMAFGVIPPFLMVYLLGAPVPRWRRLGQLSLAALVLATVSLSWSVAYQLTPAASRPFVDSTTDNSMLELAVVHNGIERFIHRSRIAGGAHALPASATPTSTDAAARLRGWRAVPAGALRLAAPSLASQIGWLMPLALLGGLAAWLWPRRRPKAQTLALAMWAGWTLAYGLVFSSAGGIFHGYYLVVMAPALAALDGIGAVTLWSLWRSRSAAALMLPSVILITGLWQAHILYGDAAGSTELGVLGAVVVLGASAALALSFAGLWLCRREAPLALAGLALALALSLPLTWSIGSGVARARGGFPVAEAPFRGHQEEAHPVRDGQFISSAAADPKLISFLQANCRGANYLLATLNARQAAPLIIATGIPVMALGGFSGNDSILTVDEFARLVADGQVPFALIGDANRRMTAFDGGRQKGLADWIRTNGRLIDPSLWQSTASPGHSGHGDASERVGLRLYDLRFLGRKEG
jgi:4-amino-4-deoxy-L-arabinose transferase-like glycosyltransferase